MVDGDNVAAQVCDDPGNIFQLTRLVQQLNVEHTASAGHEQTTLDNTGQDGHVDVAAGNQADYLFALYRDFVKHCRSHRCRTCALCDEFLFSISARMAAEISSSVTVTMSSTYFLTYSKV